MEKFRLPCRTTFLKCWLLAITYQSTECLSEEYPASSYQWDYSSQPTNEPGVAFNSSEYGFSNPESFNRPNPYNQDYPKNYSEPMYFKGESSYPTYPHDTQMPPNYFSNPVNEQQPPSFSTNNYSYSEPNPDWYLQDSCQDGGHPDFSQPAFYPAEITPYGAVNWSPPDEHQIESYFIDPSPSNQQPVQEPCYPDYNFYFNDQTPLSLPPAPPLDVPQPLNPLPTPLRSNLPEHPAQTEPEQTFPPIEPLAPQNENSPNGISASNEDYFKQAKSSTKIIKKAPTQKESSSSKETTTIVDSIGKKNFNAPTVGAIHSPSSLNMIAEEDLELIPDIAQLDDNQTNEAEFKSKLKPAISIPNSKLVEKQDQSTGPLSHSKNLLSPKKLIAQTDENSDSTLPTTTPETPRTPRLDISPSAPEETQPISPTGTYENNEQPLEIPSPTETPTPETPIPQQQAPTQAPVQTSTPAVQPTEIPGPSSGSTSTTTITPSATETIIQTQPTPTSTPETTSSTVPAEESPMTPQPLKEISINFNNVAMIEYIRFISRISNKNFIFDDEDLQFTVTIVSEEPTSIENLMAALLQELKIRDLLLIEQGNNIIIHRNPRVRAPAHIVAEGLSAGPSKESELVTRVFRLNTLDPQKAGEIIRPLLSDDALVEVLRDSNNLIITDLVANVNKISQLINSLDAPNSGMVIGQYAVRNAFVDSLATLADKILQPIAQGNPYVLIPHPATNSIFIVSNPFIVERALAILENLDMNEGRTKIFTLERLRLQEGMGEGNAPGVPSGGPGGGPGQIPGIGTEGINTGPGSLIEERERQRQRELERQREQEREMQMVGGISTNPRWVQELPPGHIERTLFFIYKLKYRRGDQIELALRKIADSLIITGTTNEDLIAAINSIQWLESSNSLIFTGTVLALDKVRELIEEIDVPLRQVFIEMLILDTTIADSLNYGVDWGNQFGGGQTAGSVSFLSAAGDAFINSLNLASVPTTSVPPAGLSPIGLSASDGFNLGVIGRHLTHGGLRFNSIGALVTAIHTDGKTNIIMNPKIITEDNNTAEIFVGSTERFKTQSIANGQGSVITNNFQFIDVGTTLRVTPLIGNNDIITLDIVEEITNDSGVANNVVSNTSINDVNLVPVLSKNRTLTRVHVPNGFFVVLSGMINDTKSRAVTQIPCLGGIPIIGGIAKQKGNRDDKRNLMIFIRPLIIDSDDDFENITKRQQDVYREKNKFRRTWNYEIDQALEFFNIKPADPDEIGCTVK